ncbi:hypothetical protein HSBAA_01330 [Vreelandella sulfidaeris]|uniref:Secreted protein n=1 Tax=Vreelandella sulfidaeris TaxID=115553 RepID=A0A455U015_9GAMM|nr:hypothetical protein HSBAA_01330 [Halomonas sulfidaeris]
MTSSHKRRQRSGKGAGTWLFVAALSCQCLASALGATKCTLGARLSPGHLKQPFFNKHKVFMGASTGVPQRDLLRWH